MQLYFESPLKHAITGYDSGVIYINEVAYKHSVLIGSNGYLQPWHTHTAQALTSHDLADLAALAAADFDLVLLGTGSVQRFPEPAWLAPFIERGIALEVMHTPAACRTYTLLAADRPILAALWL